MKLYDYWRSSASYRVRIGAALKGLDLERVAVDLKGGAHLSGALDGLNPQRLVPVLEEGERVLTQSMAILEYLDETYPKRKLLSSEPWVRAQQRSMALVIAADVHPICNLRVLKRLRAMGQGEELQAWMTEWMHSGFAALEAAATDRPFLGGDRPMLPDVVLVPQMYNARRFEIPLGDFPKLVAITERCEALPAFASAAPVEPA